MTLLKKYKFFKTQFFLCMTMDIFSCSQRESRWLQIVRFRLKPEQRIAFAYIGFKYSFAASCCTAHAINPPFGPTNWTANNEQSGRFIAGQATQFSVWFDYKREAMTAELN